MNTRSFATATILAVSTSVVLASLAVGTARADDVVADSSNHGVVVAAGTASALAGRSGPRAIAAVPRGIVVTGHQGKPVTLFAEGHAPIRKARPGTLPATFTGLDAGTGYTVLVGGTSLGRVTAIDRPTSVSRLVVHSTSTPGTVTLTWRYSPTRATGGLGVAFTLTATSTTTTAVSSRVSRTRDATLSGLDPQALYTFSITPSNSAGRGRSTTARMTKTLAQLSPTAPAPAPTAPAPTSTPTPSPTPSPTQTAPPAPPAPGPATTTVYVCPDGYAQVGGLCQTTMAYTYDIKPFTYHSEPVYGYGQTGWNYSAGYCTGSGYSRNWPNGDPYCQTPVFGDGAIVGYQSVKDAAPAGYTDSGTDWRKKNAPPAGYLDDGTQWVKTVPLIARVVSV